MKKLENTILLYDAECPLCRVYSKGFVRAGMLPEEGRVDYCQVNAQIKESVDMNRARNEIALLDTQSQTVTYGVDSLLRILGNSFPVLKGLFSFSLPYVLARRLYSFVSYNRRIIICGNDPEAASACKPDFHLGWRLAFLSFAALVSSSILLRFSPLLGVWWPMPHGWVSEIILVSGQVLFQGLALLYFSVLIPRARFFDYLGNLMTVALMGSLLLLPTLWIHHFFPLPIWVYLGWFALVVAFMFFEHKRRVKAYSLPAYLSYTWLGYRALATAIGLTLTASL